MDIIDIETGLDLSAPDSWTEQEEASFAAWYMTVKGETMRGHDFWIANRPDVLKRYRPQAILMYSKSGGHHNTKIAPLSYLHSYAIMGFEPGIRYQIINATRRGRATKQEILATLAVAFLHAGPRGMHHVATAAQDLIGALEQTHEPSGWPDGWEIDPNAFVTGLDFSKTELTPGELESLERWYQKVCGEIPAHIRFLSRHRPEVLKSFRNRYENAIRDALPKQMMPLLELQWNVTRESAPGIREATQMARGFGVSKALTLDAVCRGLIYCGPSGISVVEEAAGDVFDQESWT